MSSPNVSEIYLGRSGPGRRACIRPRPFGAGLSAASQSWVEAKIARGNLGLSDLARAWLFRIVQIRTRHFFREA